MAQSSETISVDIPSYTAQSGSYPYYDDRGDAFQVLSDLIPLPQMKRQPEIQQPQSPMHTFNTPPETSDDTEILEQYFEQDFQIQTDSLAEPSAAPQLHSKKTPVPASRRRTSARATARASPKLRQRRGRPKAVTQSVPSKPKRTKRTSANENKVWEVEEVVDSIIEAETYVHYYQVKWKGYPIKENTWEPKRHLLNCQEAIDRFERAR